MIELRWKLVPYFLCGGPDSDKPVKIKRVLQFRTTVTSFADEYHETGMRSVRFKEWSEWKNVPDVHEDYSPSAAGER